MLLDLERERGCPVKGVYGSNELLQRGVHGLDFALEVLNLAVRNLNGCAALFGAIGGAVCARRRTRIVFRKAVGAVHRLLPVRTERYLAARTAAITLSVKEFLLRKGVFLKWAGTACTILFLILGHREKINLRREAHKARGLRPSCEMVGGRPNKP